VTLGIGGWLAALIIGVLLLVLGPRAPQPVDLICRVLGWILVIAGVVLFVLWLLSALGAGV
jgi:hypothetical protein